MQWTSRDLMKGSVRQREKCGGPAHWSVLLQSLPIRGRLVHGLFIRGRIAHVLPTCGRLLHVRPIAEDIYMSCQLVEDLYISWPFVEDLYMSCPFVADLYMSWPFEENFTRRLRSKCDGTRAETRFLPSTKRTSPFKSAGASVQSTSGSRGVRISGGNAGYTMFRGSVNSTGYPLHSPVSPSLPLPCVTVYHHISTGLYYNRKLRGSRDVINTNFWPRKSKRKEIYLKNLIVAVR
jgi:hypothetical protein